MTSLKNKKGILENLRITGFLIFPGLFIISVIIISILVDHFTLGRIPTIDEFKYNILATGIFGIVTASLVNILDRL